jgi:hypothetical protein
MSILGLNLGGNHSAIIIGVIVGVLVAFTRKGAATGDGIPLSGK